MSNKIKIKAWQKAFNCPHCQKELMPAITAVSSEVQYLYDEMQVANNICSHVKYVASYIPDESGWEFHNFIFVVKDLIEFIEAQGYITEINLGNDNSRFDGTNYSFKKNGDTFDPEFGFDVPEYLENLYAIDCNLTHFQVEHTQLQIVIDEGHRSIQPITSFYCFGIEL